MRIQLRHYLKYLLAGLMAAGTVVAGYAAEDNQEVANQRVLTIYDEAIFFDGYNTLANLSEESKAMIPEDDGILRLQTFLYSVKLTEEQLAQIGESFTMKVEIGALCDNYDRIGNVNFAFVPKGAESYKTDEVSRIEVARFITPFMNKNIQPTVVPYEFKLDDLSILLHDKKLREEFDIWVEFEVFGVPYAANSQVYGCAGRQDVFTGTLYFITDDKEVSAKEGNILIPIVIKNQFHGNFNNYKEGCTDEIGRTVKTWKFNVEDDVADSELMLIISNHGANSGGEEYNRRDHIVYIDDKIVMIFTPGRTSCEPFRQYNTQLNGIYGYSEMTDAQWQSFSNWCPGDKIDNRIIHTGQMAKGEHTVKINVPKAKFNGGQGDFPVSMYFHGVNDGNLTAKITNPEAPEYRSSISVSKGKLSVRSEELISDFILYNVNGEILYHDYNSNHFTVNSTSTGVHIVAVEYEDGLVEYHKVII